MLKQWQGRLKNRSRCSAGFTFVEVIVALSILSVVSVFALQGFIGAMAQAGRSNENAAATTLAMQVMEQIRASVNPYTMVGFTDVTRSPLPLPAPFAGVINLAPHVFEVAVDVTPNPDLTLITTTVQVFRPADVTPYIVLMTVLDDQ